MNLTFKKTMLAMALTATAGFAQAQVVATNTDQTLIDFTDAMGKLDLVTCGAGVTNTTCTNGFQTDVIALNRGDSLIFGKEAVDYLTDPELKKISERSLGSDSLRDAVKSQADAGDKQVLNDTLYGRWITVRPGSRVQPDNYIWVHLDGLAAVSSNSVQEPDNYNGTAPFAIKANNALRLVDSQGHERARFAKAKVDSAGNFVAIQFQFTSKWPVSDTTAISDETGLSIATSSVPEGNPVVSPATVGSPTYVVGHDALRAASASVTTAVSTQCFASLRTGFATQSNTSTLPALSSKNAQVAACVRPQYAFDVLTGVDRIDVNQDRKYFVDFIDDVDYAKGDFERKNRQVAKEGRIRLTTDNEVDYGFTPSLTKYQYVISAPQAAQSALLPDNGGSGLYAAAAYSASLYDALNVNPTSPYYNSNPATNLLHGFCGNFTCTGAGVDGATHRPAVRDLAALKLAPEFVRLAVAGEVVHTNGIKDPNQWVIFDKDYTIALDIVSDTELGWTSKVIPATLANNKIISWEGNGSNVYIPYMPYRAENMGQVINLKNWSDTQVGKVKASIVLQDGTALPEVTVGTLNAKSILMASGPIRAAIDAYRATNNIAATEVTRAAITLYSGASLDKVEVFSAYNNGSATAVVTNSSNKSDAKAAVKQSTHFNCTDTADVGGNTSCHDENVEETPIP